MLKLNYKLWLYKCFCSLRNESKTRNRTLFYESFGLLLSVQFGFLDSFNDEQNNLYSQSYIINNFILIWKNFLELS